MPTILVIDDNPAVATALETLFSLHDLHTHAVTSPEAGLALLAREQVDLVVQDMNFQADTTSGEEGVALFTAIRERYPDLPVILLTAWTHLESAVDLVRAVELRQLRACPVDDGGCGFLFLDRSRNHSRQWCTMQDCGNVSKVRRFRQRRRGRTRRDKEDLR